MVEKKRSMERSEIVTTNQKIALHAKRKELSSALELFNSLYSQNAANSHTYASMINAAVQCGDLQLAEEIVQKMIQSGRKLHREVILCTTLMKGYCNNGQLGQAMQLFKEMLERNAKDNQPNIRTVNTLLRGCVQMGAVREAEEIFTILLKDLKLSPDVSAWEYLLILQCQNLDLDKILPAIGRIKDDASMKTGLLRIHLCLTRCCAILGESKSARRFLSTTQQLLSQSNSEDEQNHGGSGGNDVVEMAEILEQLQGKQSQQGEEQKVIRNAQKTITGGKRAWNSLHQQSTESVDEARNQSLALYRDHINQEARSDLALVEAFLQGHPQHCGFQAFQSLCRYLRRLISLPSSLPIKEKGEEDEGVGKKLWKALLERFGLQVFAKRLTRKTIPQLLDELDQVTRKAQKEGKASVDPNSVDLQVGQELSLLQSRLDNYFQPNGQFSFDVIFDIDKNDPKKTHRPLKMEICSGAGEWASIQAKSDEGRSDWMTLEVRQDRVYHTFARMMMQDIQNLAVLGGDAMKLLPQHFPDDALEYIFVNYPEPPQQRAGDDHSEARHLLTTPFFEEVYRILKTGGRLVILTDNLWYGKLVTRILSEQEGVTWKSVTQRVSTVKGQGKKKYFGEEEKEEGTSPEEQPAEVVVVEESGVTSQWKSILTMGSVVLYEGEPGPQAGHLTSASSYFDRLWQRSSQQERYFIALEKVQANTAKGSSKERKGKTETQGGASLKPQAVLPTHETASKKKATTASKPETSAQSATVGEEKKKSKKVAVAAVKPQVDAAKKSASNNLPSTVSKVRQVARRRQISNDDSDDDDDVDSGSLAEKAIAKLLAVGNDDEEEDLRQSFETNKRRKRSSSGEDGRIMLKKKRVPLRKSSH